MRSTGEIVNRFFRFIASPAQEKVALTAFFIMSILGGLFLGFLVFSIESRKNIDYLASFQPNLPTRIYDVEGRQIAELFQHQRDLVSLEDIPRSVIAAFLAVEDEAFYDHFGLDFMGILRAAWANIKAGEVVQGGSTLTQQLVKGLFTEGEKTFVRKFYEAVLALQVEREFSKNEILEMYFNQTYFGHGTYGIASAARFYFNKPVQKLNLIEGSILAALPKSPHTYSPFRSPHRSLKKNKSVLNKLADLGYLQKSEVNKLHSAFWKEYWQVIIVTPPTKTIFGNKKNAAPYFTEYIRQELVGLFGEDEVYSRGLQVYTTLNLDHQQFAEEALYSRLEKQDPIARRANLRFGAGVDYRLLSTYNMLRSVLPLPGVVRKYSLRNDFRAKFKNRISDAFELVSLQLPVRPANDISVEFLGSTAEFKSELHVQGALVSLEPGSGRITAMVGGREFKASDQFNRAMQARRQPGSAFKPFVYGAALEDRAVHYAMGFLDSPILNIQPDGSMWAPANYEGGYKGYVMLYRALQMSLNLVSVQVYDLVGPDKIIDFASRLTKVPPSRFQPNPALALGASELTPFELLLGFSTIGNEGREVIPHGIIYITDRDGNVIHHSEREIFDVLNYKKKNDQLQVIEKGIAFIVRKMMQGVVNGGTARGGVRIKGGYKGPAAGKTGTTSGWGDAWFGGFTPDLAAVVWMGMDQGVMTLGRHQSGGVICAPVWGEFMKKVYDDRGELPEDFSEKIPKGVRRGAVNKFTGKWPNPECDTPETLAGTYIPRAVRVGNRTKRVGGERYDCDYVETKSFLERVQEQHEVSDDEIGRERDYDLY